MEGDLSSTWGKRGKIWLGTRRDRTLKFVGGVDPRYWLDTRRRCATTILLERAIFRAVSVRGRTGGKQKTNKEAAA